MKIFRNSRIPTGICISFVTCDGERTFLISRGANDCLSLEDITKISDSIAKAGIIYISGYSLVNQPTRNSILHAIQTAIRFETKIFFDPASNNLIDAERDLFLGIAKNSNYLCLNFDEACALTQKQDLSRVVSSLRKIADFVALKLGGSGCIIVSQKEVVKVDADKVPCIDSTGAGDCFASAIIYGLRHNLSLWAMGKLGNFFGGYNVQQLGATAFPAKKRIQNFLKEIRIQTC